MNNDGTPETEFEAWALEYGLGPLFVEYGDVDLTRSQVDVLMETEPDYIRNPKHRVIVNHFLPDR